jgi:ribosomal protein S18 acetylase RimI-like enzyme
MEVIRHFYEMHIEFDNLPEAPAVPEGIEIRSFDPETELAGVALTYQDSFKDHFGFVEEPFEKLMEGVRYMIENDPHYDPAFWFVAMDGDQMAGISLCSPKTIEDPEMGFVDVLGVRRPWRGRGLGLALLQHSFVQMVGNGSKRAGLGVDASSLTGATRLYEKAGMSVARQYNAYRKILREGQDISTTEI